MSTACRPAVSTTSCRVGAGTGISKSEVSRICSELDETVGAFRTRTLDHTPFPYVYLDPTYLHVRPARPGLSMAVVVATGIGADGCREVLGLDVGDSEDETFWRGFLLSSETARPGRGAVGHLRPALRARGSARPFKGPAPAVPGPLGA